MEINNLAQLVQNANRAYRSGTPLMADAEFDALERQLAELDPAHPVLAQREDDWGSEFQEDAKLTLFMGSQDKALNLEELQKWINKVRTEAYLISGSYKMDGMSVELTYINGHFTKAITRGSDGLVGKVITPILMQASFPKKIQTLAEVAVIRGEVILPKTGLKHANTYLEANGREPMANVRNGAVAITRTMKNLPMANLLKVVAFDIEDGTKIQTLQGKFDKLEELGFSVPVNECLTTDDLLSFIKRAEQDRESLDYDIDGIVFSVDILDTLEELGVQGNCKRGQIAYKFQAQGDYVTIQQVLWSFDGTEFASPVAVFDPIEIGGSTITRASLKSYRWLIENKVGVGSVLKLVRSGDVIPTFIDGDIKHNPEEQVINLPDRCPHCTAPLIVLGAQLACENDFCLAKEAARINKFFKAVDVKGLAVQTLRQYTAQGVTLADFFEDDLEKITNKIRANPDISLKVWAKVKKQIEDRV